MCFNVILQNILKGCMYIFLTNFFSCWKDSGKILECRNQKSLEHSRNYFETFRERIVGKKKKISMTTILLLDQIRKRV